MKEIKSSGGHAIGISTDVSSPSDVKNAFAEIQKEFKGKKLAAAIYNVGGKFVRKPFLEMTLEEYEAGYEANGYVFYFLEHCALFPRAMLIPGPITAKDSTFSPKPYFHSFSNLSRAPHTLPVSSWYVLFSPLFHGIQGAELLRNVLRASWLLRS